MLKVGREVNFAVLLILLVLLHFSRRIEASEVKITPKQRGQYVGSGLAKKQILVKLKERAEISYEGEILIAVPFTSKEIKLREQGFRFKGMAKVTKVNKKLKVKSVQKLGEIEEIEEMVRVELPEDVDLQEAISQYSQEEEVEYAEPDYVLKATWIPDDDYLSQDPLHHFQWNLARINMPEAWNFEPRGGSESVKVAIIDSGVAFEDYFDGQTQFKKAPELEQVGFESALHINITESCTESCNCDWKDVPVKDLHPNDDAGHGTHITATVVQATNNSAHAAGIAFESTIIPIKVLNSCGSTLSSSVISGIDYAVANGAKVINLSLGGGPYSQSMRDAMIAATQAGVVVVAASGNGAYRTNSYGVIYPAAYPEVIAVGATRWDNRRSDYSDYGPELDIVAPGGQAVEDDFSGYLDQNEDLLPDGIVQQTIDPTDFTKFTAIGEPGVAGLRCLVIDGFFVLPDDTCGIMQGTSMATPHVTAAVALLFSANPDLTPQEIMDVLKQTAAKAAIPDYNENEHGAGLLDVAAALAEVQPEPILGDIDGDGDVDWFDFNLLAGDFGRQEATAADIDGDGDVDIFDYSILIENFGLN